MTVVFRSMTQEWADYLAEPIRKLALHTGHAVTVHLEDCPDCLLCGVSPERPPTTGAIHIGHRSMALAWQGFQASGQWRLGPHRRTGVEYIATEGRTGLTDAEREPLERLLRKRGWTGAPWVAIVSVLQGNPLRIEFDIGEASHDP